MWKVFVCVWFVVELFRLTARETDTNVSRCGRRYPSSLLRVGGNLNSIMSYPGSAPTTAGEPPSRSAALLIDARIANVRGTPDGRKFAALYAAGPSLSLLHQHIAGFASTTTVLTTTYLDDVRRRQCVIIGLRRMKFIFALGFWNTGPPSSSTSDTPIKATTVLQPPLDV